MAVSATFKRGDDATLATVTISDGVTPVDLTNGYSITWQVRRQTEAKDALVVDVDLSDALNGNITGTLPAITTATMSPGTWVSDIEVTGPDGTLSSDTFEVVVVADVTREIPT
jgi:hypothetical protein